MISIWYDAQSAPLEIPAGNQYSTVLVVHVDPGANGTAQVQFRDSDEIWYTPDDFAFSEKRPQMIEYSNSLPLRIIATGTAKYQISTAVKFLATPDEAPV